MPDAAQVVHDPKGHRFVIALEGHEAFLLYRQSGNTLDFHHTFVPQVFRGRGLAEKLCQAGFAYAKANGLTVIPSCPYVAETYLKRHPEYQALVKTA